MSNFTPAWFKKGFFNESLFCDDFLSTHQLLYSNGAFFTPDGRMVDPMPLRCEIFEMMREYVGANLAKKVTNVVDLKLTRHNGRAGTHGTYNPKHNDRSFNLANSEHIDSERAKGNIYWDCFHGFRSALAPQDPDDLAATFSDVERQFYEIHYTAFICRIVLGGDFSDIVTRWHPMGR